MATAAGFADVSIQLINSAMSRPAYITFGIDAAATDPVTVALGVSTAWAATGSMFQRCDASVTMRQVRVSLGTDGGEDLVGLAATAVVGTSATNSVPPNVSVLVHKTTSRGGRRGRGRLFLPWFVSSTEVTENGNIGSAAMTGLQNAVDTFLSQLNSGPGPMVILHGPGKTLPGAPNVVTRLSVDALVATQRRRLGR